MPFFFVFKQGANLMHILVEFINPNRAEIFSHLIHAGGGVIYDPPLISGHSGHKGTN